MEAAVLWLVLWGVFALVGPGIVCGAVALISIGIAEATDDVGWAFVGAVIGWLGGIGWFIFAAVQTVFQIISVANLASG